MLKDFVNLHPLFDVASKYLDGAASIVELHGAATRCRKEAQLAGLTGDVVDWLREWERQTYRRWNELGDVADPLTENDFAEWLHQHLVFRER